MGVNVCNCVLMSLLELNRFLVFTVEGRSPYIKTITACALQTNQIKSTFTVVNISVSKPERDTERLACCSKVTILENDLQQHFSLSEMSLFTTAGSIHSKL